MKLKTIMKIGLRCIAIIVLFNSFVSGIRLLSFLVVSPEARAMQIGLVYTELGRAVIGLIFGLVLFKLAERFTAVFGKDYDFSEKLEVVNARSMVAAIYSIFGVWLIVFSLPDLLEELIRLQTSYYGASVNDLNTAIQKYSIVGDVSRIVIGVVLVKFNKWLPPLNNQEAVGSENSLT